jgi:hypothetical protein
MPRNPDTALEVFFSLIRLTGDPSLPAALVCRPVQDRRITTVRQPFIGLMLFARKGPMPMILVLLMAFEISVALALGFVLGRIYQIRHDELERRDGFALPPTARIPQA